MGLAASQVRMLSLTSRKASIERDILQGSNRKIALSREMNNLANEYYDALSAEKLMYLSDTGEYTRLSYQYLMGKPGGIEDIDVKSDRSMLLIDTLSGNVVLSQAMYDKMREVVRVPNTSSLGQELAKSSENIYLAIANLCGDVNITTPEDAGNLDFIISPELVKDICAGKYDTFDEQDLADAINNEKYFLYTPNGPTMHNNQEVDYINQPYQTTNPGYNDYSAGIANVLSSNIGSVTTSQINESYSDGTILKITNGYNTKSGTRDAIKNFVRQVAVTYFSDDSNYYDSSRKTYENLKLEKKLAVAKVLESFGIKEGYDTSIYQGLDSDLLLRDNYAYMVGSHDQYEAYIDTKLLLNALQAADTLTPSLNYQYKTVYGTAMDGNDDMLHTQITGLGKDSEGNQISAYLDELFCYSADKNLDYTNASEPNNGLVQIGRETSSKFNSFLNNDCLTDFVNQIAETVKNQVSSNVGLTLYSGGSGLAHSSVTNRFSYYSKIEQAALETIDYFKNNMITATIDDVDGLQLTPSTATNHTTPYFNTENITGYTDADGNDTTLTVYSNIMTQWGMWDTEQGGMMDQADSTGGTSDDRMHLYRVKEAQTGTIYDALGGSDVYYYVDASALITHFYARLLGEDIGYDTVSDTNAYNNEDFKFLSQLLGDTNAAPQDVSNAGLGTAGMLYDYPDTTTGAYTPYVTGSTLKTVLSIRGKSAKELLGTEPAGANSSNITTGIWYNSSTGTGQKFVPAGETTEQWIKNFKDLIADVKFYFTIVTACAKHGATTDYSANLADGDYIDKNIQNGVFQLMGFETDVFSLNSAKDTDYYLLTSEFSKMNDPAQQAIITAWYESEKAEITSKETYWDTLIENLSAELNSVNAEIESVKTLIDDAVKNTFNWGKG